MFTDARSNEASSLGTNFGQQKVGHEAGIVIVEMTNGFVGNEEVEGLHQGAQQGYALLLTVRHPRDERLCFVSDTELLEPKENLPTRLPARESVLDFYVLDGGELGKEAQFLKQMRHMRGANRRPIFHSELADVGLIESNATGIVVAIAHEITAKSALSLSALSLEEIETAFLKDHIALPEFGIQMGYRRKYLWQDMMKVYLVHFYRIL